MYIVCTKLYNFDENNHAHFHFEYIYDQISVCILTLNIFKKALIPFLRRLPFLFNMYIRVRKSGTTLKNI